MLMGFLSDLSILSANKPVDLTVIGWFYSLSEPGRQGRSSCQGIIKGVVMENKRTYFLFTVVLGLVSAGCVVLCYLACKYIWFDQGDRLMQWKLLKLGLWPIVIFHAVFFINATTIMSGWRKK